MVRRSDEGTGSIMEQRDERDLALEPFVIRADDTSVIRSLFATLLWGCSISLTCLLCFICLLALYLRSLHFLWILGVLVILAVGPISDKSKYGSAIGRFIGRYSPGYFHTKVYFDDATAFDDSRSYVIAAEPHSIFPVGAICLLNITGLMPLAKSKVLASTAIFYTPFLRQVTTWMGLIPATRKNFVNYLKAGYSCIVIPGGVQEIAFMNKDYEVAFLKKRLGFIRVAIETGSPLVPVFSFGQNNAFNWWKPKGQLYARLSRAMRFAPLFFWGVLGMPIPYRSPIHVVVGKPIEVKQNLNPDPEEVSRVHSLFLSNMEALFSKYKAVTGNADAELRIY